MKLLAKLQASREFWLLLVTSIIFFFLRLPSLFEPYWYGDEGIYEVIGYALRHGRLLYTGIWDNKPPVLYLIYAIFQGDQAPAKLLSLLAGLAAIWVFFFLSKRLFAQFFPAALATTIFAFLFALPLIEGNIANAENFMLLPAILAGYLIWNTVVRKPTLHSPLSILNLLYAGLLVGISFLIKVVGVFDLFAFGIFIFLFSLESFSLKTIGSSIKKVVPLFFGFLIPVVLCVGFFIIMHSFSIFFHATLLSNVGYVNYANQFTLPFIKHPIPQGFLLLKTFLLGLVVLFFLFLRKKLSAQLLFIGLWIAFSLYNSLFSGRAYTHYALVILPSFALLVGLFVKDKATRIISAVLLILSVVIVIKSFSFYDKTLRYYENFAQLITGQKSVTAYQSFFDQNVPRDYAVAQFINTHKKPNQTLFLWGNSGQIYKLTNTMPPGRFIVAYWIEANIPETKLALDQHPPKFIVTFSNADVIPFSLAHYEEVATIDGATIYEYIL